MATYLQSVQDRVEKVNPPQTDWQFEAQLLQTRQSKYDAGHKKLSDLYGKILNAGLSREDNIKARDDFFKIVDQDLKKIAGMDLSLDSNVSKAQNVFSQIYENDFLVKDMVWTKEFNNQMERAEGFRYCADPEKCGGQYWDDGVKYMQYKREEFKNASNKESLGFSNVQYVPYNNMMDKAIKYAKDAGLNVVQDKIDGRYKVTTKNGELVVTPLTDMFRDLFGKNPQFQEMYKVKAYNERKDEIYNSVAMGEYASVKEATSGYIQKYAQDAIARTGAKFKELDSEKSMLEAKVTAMDIDLRNGTLDKNDPKVVAQYNELTESLNKANAVKEYTDLIKAAQKNVNDQSTMIQLSDMLDSSRSFELLEGDILNSAKVLAHRDYEMTLEEDKYGLAEQKFSHDIYLANLNATNDRKLEEKKAELAGTKINTDAIERQIDYEKSLNGYNKLESEYLDNITTYANSKTSSIKGTFKVKSLLDVKKWIDANKDGTNKTDVDEITKKYNTAMEALKVKADETNKAAVVAYEKHGDWSKINIDWNMMTPETYDLLLDQNTENLNIPKSVSRAFENGFESPVVKLYDENDNLMSNLRYTKEDGKWFYENKDGSWKPVTNTERLTLLEHNAKPY